LALVVPKNFGSEPEAPIRNEGIFMQRFVAELSSPIEKADFERSWQSGPGRDARPKVEFAFMGPRVSVVVHSDIEDRWPMANFYQAFSATVRRLNSNCNVRWL
jgi:hypothetical protein